MRICFPWLAGAVSALLIGSQVAVAADSLPAKQFPHPDRIRYDGQCLTIDGQDTFIFSGAFHYFRTPKALWRERFQKIKDAHFNAVETYVPWNLCEQQMPAGLDDFSKTDLTDLKDWLKMAQEEFGLYTIIRPGPYICAEWAGGGYPQWLWAKRPKTLQDKAWVRGDDPTYLQWSKHWYDQVVPVIAAEQITRKPKGAKGVILFQIENEYDYWGAADAVKMSHLKFLYQNAVADGIDVPIFTCWTRQVRGSHDPVLSQAFDSSNFYHRWGLGGTVSSSLDLRAKQPNAPVMVTELQGGWFAGVGGQLSEEQGGIEPEQTNAITLTSIANNATILNYYMLVGGSNFGAWGSTGMLQTYDYFAPIRESGGGGPKYEVVKAIGTFLAEQGAVLARSQITQAELLPADGKVNLTVRTTADGKIFAFVRNSTGAAYHVNTNLKLESGLSVAIDRDLPARITEVLVLPSGSTRSSDGKWYCEPAPEADRPAVLPPVRVAAAVTRDDPGPTHWQPIDADTSLIDAGIYAIDDVVYRAAPTLNAEQAAKFVTVRVESDEMDRLAMRVNGQLAPARSAGTRANFAVQGLLKEGPNRIEVLYENPGTGNFGERLNKVPSIRGMSLLQQSSEGRPLEAWRVAIVKDAGKAAIATDFDDSAWDQVVLNEQTFAELAASKQPGHPPLTYPAMNILRGKSATAVYRTVVDLDGKDAATKPLMIDLQRIDDQGEIYVNGQHVGSSNNWRVPFIGDISHFVHEGKNVIAVVVKNVDYDGGLMMPVQIYSENDQLSLKMEVGEPYTGVAEQWWNHRGGDGWQPMTLDTASVLPTRTGKPAKRSPQSAAGQAEQVLGKWFQTEFELPALQVGIWAPWSAVLDASGNGFLYLNGHELGRYYDAGPQRQFYLPECWLKTGAGEKNTLTLLLHPTNGNGNTNPSLRGLEFRQYPAQAERR